MSILLCENCGERPATVFITKVVNSDSISHHYCERCARERAVGEGWLAHLTEQLGEELPLLQEQIEEALAGLSLDDIVRNLIEVDDDEPGPTPNEASRDPGPGDEDEDEDEPERAQLHDPDQQGLEDDDFVPPSTARELSVRCVHCGTTWDRLKQDGRAGCASCYNEFRLQLHDVMTRLQSGTQHCGKTPRAAEKRRRRLQHLRQRRDHQLDLLQGRLKDAVAAERYEDAAKLRDKIKQVTATIVKD